MLASQDDAAMADYVNTMAGLTRSGEEANLASGDGELVSSSMLTRTIDAIDVCLNKIKELSDEHADDSPGDTMSLPGLGDTVSLPGLDDGTENPPESDVAEPSPSPTPSVPEDSPSKGPVPEAELDDAPDTPKGEPPQLMVAKPKAASKCKASKTQGKPHAAKSKKKGSPKKKASPTKKKGKGPGKNTTSNGKNNKGKGPKKSTTAPNKAPGKKSDLEKKMHSVPRFGIVLICFHDISQQQIVLPSNKLYRLRSSVKCPWSL